MTRYRDIVNGLYFGYPVCCVIWFALGGLLGMRRQAVCRGYVDIDEDRSYVVCCHWKHPNWLPFGYRRYERNNDG